MSTLPTEFLDLQAALAGEYSLERELGRGGMGIVYLARDVQLDRHVAIKVLPSHLAAEPESRARFLREARTAAGLSHPNIVPIHRVGESAGFVFFVMSYVAGQTLGERLRTSGALPAASVTRILQDVAWALAYAHGHGVVHRDVKPDNILLEEESGRAMVTDFGIAHVGSDGVSTEPGRIMGTAQFMSPEQAVGESVDGRSDLYSLGVVGYLAASGRLPFEAANVPALLRKQAMEAARPVDDVAPGMPRALASAIHRCLEKDPAHRFASGEALASALAPSTTGRPPLPASLRSWLATRNPAVIVYAGWTGLSAIEVLSALGSFVNYHHRAALIDLLTWSVLSAAPLVPIIGVHASQARRLFGLGFTLADLRGALDIAAREREETEGPPARARLDRGAKALRGITYGAASLWASLVFLYPMATLTLEKRHILIPLQLIQTTEVSAVFISLLLLTAANMAHVPILPSAVRRFFRRGITERLWRSRFGEFLAKRLGAPAASRPVGVGIFQATELALSVAAEDLFKALPLAYREQLSELPMIVHALEARAAAARAEMESLDAAPRLGIEPGLMVERRAAAHAQLTRSVGALEGVRIDLLRLHAGACDLAPLTTLLDAARELGAHAGRIAEAQLDIEDVVPRQRIGRGWVPTPV
jgi:predicted Ser/Thr protein kinase